MAHAGSWDDAAQRLTGVLDPFNGAVDGSRHALSLKHICGPELGRGAEFLDESLAGVFVHVQDCDIAALLGDVDGAGAA